MCDKRNALQFPSSYNRRFENKHNNTSLGLLYIAISTCVPQVLNNLKIEIET